MGPIFDSHAHYLDERFDSDRDALLNHLFQNGVSHILEAGTSPADSARALDLAHRYPKMYAAVGVHPEFAGEVSENFLAEIERLAADPKAVAIGEIGLDYHYDDAAPRDIQRTVFECQVQLANRLGLPVIIHDREAHGDMLDILRRHRPKGIVHCYSGSPEMVREIVELGLYIGFTGVVTFKNARKALQAAAIVPDDRLLVETDCPYMAPEPFRGKRCDSSMIRFTAQKLAEIRGVSLDALLEQTHCNACRVYRIESR